MQACPEKRIWGGAPGQSSRDHLSNEFASVGFDAMESRMCGNVLSYTNWMTPPGVLWV